MNESTQINISIPANRTGEFYELLGLWLQSTEGNLIRQVRAEQASQANPRALSISPRTAWEDGDHSAQVTDARTLYRGLSVNAKLIIDYLVERPDVEVAAGEIARLIGSESPQAVAGTLSSVGKHSKRVNRVFPINWSSHDDADSTYSMSSHETALFAAVRDR